MFKGLKVATRRGRRRTRARGVRQQQQQQHEQLRASGRVVRVGAPTSDVKVGLAYDIGGRGDQSFNDSAAAGLDKAVSRARRRGQGARGDRGRDRRPEGGAPHDARRGRLQPDHRRRLRLRRRRSSKVAPKFPNVNFAIVDDASRRSSPNVANLVFAENQGSFLVGAIAAQASKTGNIGFIGGVNVPLIQKFQAGYEAGAKAVNPDIKVQVKYLTEPPDFSGFGDPAKGKVAAEGMFDDGADVVYHAAGGSGGGVFDAPRLPRAWAIGVDSDQYLTAAAGREGRHPHLDAQARRRGGVRLRSTSVVKGTPLTGVQTFDLAKRRRGLLDVQPGGRSPTTAKTDELRRRSSTAPSRCRTPMRTSSDDRGRADIGRAREPVPGPIRACNVRVGPAVVRGRAGHARDAAQGGAAISTARPVDAAEAARPSSSGTSPRRSPASSPTSDINLTRAARHGPRDRRRERRRQVDADEDALRHAPAGRGHDRRRRRGRRAAPARATPSRAASAWCTSTSSSPTTSPSSRTSSSATSPPRGGRLDFAAARARIVEISDRYGLDVDPDALVEDLGVGDRQRVEILKVLYRGARTLILDEPTAVLVPQEVDELFDALRELKAEGLTIIFISHKLDEVLKVADDITVIRRGTTVATVDPADVTARQLAELMVGSELPTPETRESTVTDVEELAVEGLTLVDDDGPAAARRHLASRSTAARCSASPASRATARPSSSRSIMGMRKPSPGTCCLGDEDITAWSHPSRGARPASPTSPRTATGTACCSRRRCGRTACSATRRSRRTARAPLIDRKGARARHRSGSSTSTTCARRRSTCSPRRCPAATSRSSSSDAR